MEREATAATLITNWLCWPRTPPGRTALPGAYPCFYVRITLTQAPLCSVPGCGHSDAACPAYIEGNNIAVAAIGGNVYLMGSVYGTWFVQNAASSAAAAYIDVVDASGARRKRVI